MLPKKTYLKIFILISFLIFAESGLYIIQKNLQLNYTSLITDEEFNTKDTYQKLRKFFSGCKSPIDFYERIQETVKDAYKEGNPDTSETSLSRIVEEIEDNKANLHCVQQSLLLCAGIKAMYSNYDEKENRYYLDENYQEFKLEIWRSFDLTPPILPYRSHAQVVIDVWNGTDYFEIDGKQVDKIEVDTWENEFRTFNKENEYIIHPTFCAKLDSILHLI